MSAAASALGAEGLLTVESGYHGKTGTASTALLSAATVVTLLGVAISVAMSAAEGRAPPSPRWRRSELSRVGAATLLRHRPGCSASLAAPSVCWSEGLYGYTAHVVFGSPSFAIPWRDLAGILTAVPLFAGTLAWMLTRPRLPMLRRVD